MSSDPALKWLEQEEALESDNESEVTIVMEVQSRTWRWSLSLCWARKLGLEDLATVSVECPKCVIGGHI